jgi:hypothetical protein
MLQRSLGKIQNEIVHAFMRMDEDLWHITVITASYEFEPSRYRRNSKDRYSMRRKKTMEIWLCSEERGFSDSHNTTEEESETVVIGRTEDREDSKTWYIACMKITRALR